MYERDQRHRDRECEWERDNTQRTHGDEQVGAQQEVEVKRRVQPLLQCVDAEHERLQQLQHSGVSCITLWTTSAAAAAIWHTNQRHGLNPVSGTGAAEVGGEGTADAQSPRHGCL